MTTPTGKPATKGALRVRVRYCECDPMNVAHHAAFAPWLEMGRTELLRDAGVSYAQLEADGVFLVVTKLEMRFRRPVKYDDVVEIRTRVTGGGRVKIRHEYDVVLVDRNGAAPDPSADQSVPHDGVCAVAMTEIACVDRDGKPTQLPEWLIAGK